MYKTTCKLCGKEYDNYSRTYYVKENGIKIRVCRECRSAFCEDKYIYTNDVPTYCDGANIITRCFNTEGELLEYITSNNKNNYICCMDKGGVIVDVCKTEKFWWVRGYSNLSYGQLPDWKVVAREIYGEDWDKRTITRLESCNKRNLWREFG